MAGFKSFLKRKKKSPSPSAVEEPNGSSSPSISISSHHRRAQQQQIDELEQVFKKFDANGDGQISASELGSIMSSLGQTISEDELVRMVKEVDADGDGFISLEEFVELNTKGVDHDEIMVSLREAFSVYDIDGNGRVTAEELQTIMRSLGDNCSISDCKKMISGVDFDGDGTIDFDEFKEMMLSGSRFNGVNVKQG